MENKRTPNSGLLVPRMYILAAVILSLLALPATIFAQTTPTIDIDVGPLFTAINDNIPWVMSIYSIPGAILIAIATVGGIVALLVGAFRSFGRG